ncbi:hypothetical protein F2P79_003722 [Pimephales promelas]|nr:hypothetical protein F2P79_003722 [Pimephales promelas]
MGTPASWDCSSTRCKCRCCGSPVASGTQCSVVGINMTKSLPISYLASDFPEKRYDFITLHLLLEWPSF